MNRPLQDRLTEALDDEYKARATYRRVIERFGPVPPFDRIVEAEQRHVDALLSLFQAYRLPIPDDPWPARVTAPETVEMACLAAVAAERDNLEMYQRLLASTPERDVRLVLENLQAASRDRHLPAFERCVTRQGRRGRGLEARPRPGSRCDR